MDFGTCLKHRNIRMTRFCPICLVNERDELQAEVERLRAVLQFLEPSVRELLEVAATETAAYRRRWRFAIEQASAVCTDLDDEADHDHSAAIDTAPDDTQQGVVNVH